MDRRRFIQLTAAGSALLAHAPLLAAAPRWDRTLVWIELEGGNDGLSTVIPLRDGALSALRPQLTLPPDKALTLDSDTGLHPALGSLMYAWDGGELGVILGVGAPGRFSDHARAAGAWDTAGDKVDPRAPGWLARLFDAQPPPGALAHGAILGLGSPGPLRGSGAQAARVLPHAQAVKAARGAAIIRESSRNTALRHLIALRDAQQARANRLQEALSRQPAPTTRFPDSPLGTQLAQAARIIQGGLKVPVIKAVQRGYDTHSGQRARHGAMMTDLGAALGAFRSVMLQANVWDKVLVAVVSEFGRSPKENGAGGTDHGTSGPVLILGGALQGGIHGKQPAIKGDTLTTTTDLRALCGAIAQDWWGLDTKTIGGKPLKDLIKV